MALQTSEFAPTPTCRVASWLPLQLLPLVSACATIPLVQTGSLSSYDRLQPADGMLTKARVSVDKDAVLAARTVRSSRLLLPQRRPTKLSERDRKLVANAVDRSVCIGLSDRFQIVLPPQMADLTVHVSIASIVPTDETAAATSKVLDIGKSRRDQHGGRRNVGADPVGTRSDRSGWDCLGSRGGRSGRLPEGSHAVGERCQFLLRQDAGVAGGRRLRTRRVLRR